MKFGFYFWLFLLHIPWQLNRMLLLNRCHCLQRQSRERWLSLFDYGSFERHFADLLNFRYELMLNHRHRLDFPLDYALLYFQVKPFVLHFVVCDKLRVIATWPWTHRHRNVRGRSRRVSPKRKISFHLIECLKILN